MSTDVGLLISIMYAHHLIILLCIVEYYSLRIAPHFRTQLAALVQTWNCVSIVYFGRTIMIVSSNLSSHGFGNNSKCFVLGYNGKSMAQIFLPILRHLYSTA